MNIDKAISIKVQASQYVDYKELNHFQGDLKSISKEKFQDLKDSLIKEGLPLALHIWIDNNGKKWTLDGHHRVLAFKALESEGYFIPPIPVNIVEAKSKKEAAKIVMIANSRHARMDETSLSNFMIEMDLQLPEIELLDLIDIDMGQFDLDSDADGKGGDQDSDIYTNKIESPIYKPTGPKPSLQDLLDTNKTNSLISKIETSSIDEKEKQFLIKAAQRHLQFNYRNVAEYYAHSEKETQELFEDSALVIIDFEKAIENGFVKLTKDLAEAYELDQ